jgi:hypothetical protein
MEKGGDGRKGNRGGRIAVRVVVCSLGKNGEQITRKSMCRSEHENLGETRYLQYSQLSERKARWAESPAIIEAVRPTRDLGRKKGDEKEWISEKN